MRLSRTDALTLLREALAMLPSELDARAEFFVQRRTRTIQNLESIFPDNPAEATDFKQIDFSPRRLTKNETRDAQLKLDAFLSGCVSARAYLEETIRRLMAEPEMAMLPPPPAAPAPPVEPPPADPVIRGANMSSHELAPPFAAACRASWAPGSGAIATPPSSSPRSFWPT